MRTTPESLDLQELLAQIVNAGCKAAAMEVSSHALAQERTRGLEWDVAVFTNLTQDHLDFHGTMENYFESKAETFHRPREQTTKRKPVAIVNIDDRYGEKLRRSSGERNFPVITYGMGARADFRASNYRTEFAGTSYQLDARGKSYLVRVPLIGRFNVANSLAALAAANALGVNLREAVLSLARSPQVPGRLEAVPAKRQFQVFVDYAHTPDALLNVLKTAARTCAAQTDCCLRLRRRSRPTEAPAHGACGRSECRLQHHHFGQSAEGRSRCDHRRCRERFSF